jgi:hypothetical protein
MVIEYTSKQPVEYYNMNMYLFGATLFCAFSLKRTTKDDSQAYSNETVSTVERNFHDLVMSVGYQRT